MKTVSKTARKIKTAYNVRWMSRIACIKALQAIGYTTAEAEEYLDTPLIIRCEVNRLN